MPASSKITLYVDLVSPFAYIAYYLMRNDPVFKSCDITYVPIFLGGLMKACGNTAPINITNKNVWINKERLLWSKTFNVPMQTDMPDGFPLMTLVLMRHLAALRELDGNQKRLVELLDILTRELWVNHAAVHKPEVFGPILQKVLGAGDAAKVAEAAAGPLKKLLNENTDQAFKDDAFGLPWMVCTNPKGEKENFWGVDHLGQVTGFLGLEKPSARGWQALL